MALRESFEESVWRRISKQPDGCWIWQGRPSTQGYGRVVVPGRGLTYAHRLLYEMAVGPIPEGTELDHLCRVRMCCNPHHLEAVTHQVNIQRGIRSSKPTCPQGHLWAENAAYTSQGNRYCAECNRIRARAAKAKRPKAPPATHCRRGHPFDDENTCLLSRGDRRCRTCHRERERSRRPKG